MYTEGFARGGRTALALTMLTACAGRVWATSLGPDGDAAFGIGQSEHVAVASPDALANAASEPDQGATVAGGDALPIGVTGMSGALVINPTFDSSITGDVNAAAIQATINNAIAIYEASFNDPITVNILFRYATTQPNGSALPPGTLAFSVSVVYLVPWNTYIASLTADATTANDTTANASLPGAALTTNILPSSAGGRAVGLATPPALFANGTLGAGGPYDGIVTLNSSQPFKFTRPASAGLYDALRATEHEMDEVLGLGSGINAFSDLRPQDLFSWSAPGTRNTTSSGSRYLSIDGGTTNIVGLNQNPSGDFGDWLSGSCPQATPYVQNAFSCDGQTADVTPTSPEGINLDVIGYDLILSTTSTTTSTLVTTSSTTTSTTSSSTTTSTTLAPLCGPAPATGCHLGQPLKSSIQLKDDPDDTKDQLKWKWNKGDQTDVTDFKDPVGGSASYRVCLYDSSVNPQPLEEAALLPGGTCGTAACWKLLGSVTAPKGFKFHNGAGNSTGLTDAKLQAGLAGKAKVQVKGKGVNLAMPTLGLAMPVTIQLVIDDGITPECWQTTFTAPPVVNTSAQFKAKGP